MTQKAERMTCHIEDEQMRWEVAGSGPPNTLLLPVLANLGTLLPADGSARKGGGERNAEGGMQMLPRT